MNSGQVASEAGEAEQLWRAAQVARVLQGGLLFLGFLLLLVVVVHGLTEI